MIAGYIDEYGQPRVRVTVQGRSGEVNIEPIIDTGYDGSLCLPVPLAIQLGLQLSGTQTVELADGSEKDELLFLGTIVFDGETRPIEISLTESEDALLGTALLQDRKLEIGFFSKIVRIFKE